MHEVGVVSHYLRRCVLVLPWPCAQPACVQPQYGDKALPVKAVRHVVMMRGSGVVAVLLPVSAGGCQSGLLHSGVFLACRLPRCGFTLLAPHCRKFEEVYSPPVDEFVYISDNTYTREQVRPMTRAVERPPFPRMEVRFPFPALFGLSNRMASCLHGRCRSSKWRHWSLMP